MRFPLLRLFFLRRAAPAMSFHDPGVQYWRAGRAFGVDISDASLEATEVRRHKGGYMLMASSRLTLPEGVVQKGNIQNPDALKDALITLRSAAQPKPITRKHAIISVPETNVYIHPFTFPKTITEKQISRAVVYEAEGVLPVKISDMYTAIQFHRSRDQRHHVLFGAAPRQMIDAYVDTLVQAGLQPLAIDIEALSLSRCLIKTQTDPIILVDIGAWTTTVSVVERGAVHGTSTVTVSGEYFTEVIMRAAGVQREEAEEMKLRLGLDGVAPAVRRALEEALESIVAEIQQSAIYHEQHMGRPVREVVLAGGSAQLNGLVSWMNVRLQLSVAQGDPFVVHSFHFSPAFSESQRLAFAANRILYANSLGLALRGAQRNAVTAGINLLPLHIEKRYQQWREHFLIGVGSLLTALYALAAFVLLGSWFLTLFYARKEVVQEANVIRASLFGARFRQAQNETQTLNAQIRMLQEFYGQRMDAHRYLDLLRSHTPTGVRLVSVTITRAQPAGTSVNIQGVAATRDVLFGYAEALRRAEGVTDIQSPVSNLDKPLDADFEMTLTFAPPVSPPVPSFAP